MQVKILNIDTEKITAQMNTFQHYTGRHASDLPQSMGAGCWPRGGETRTHLLLLPGPG